ncbi:MAG: ribonuclease HII [Thermoplasmatales archaeon]
MNEGNVRQAVCGCDEAGRGPVIGPMVIAIVCGDEAVLRNLGVRDSKKLSESRREFLYDKILNVSQWVDYRIVTEEEIDRAVSNNGLNILEANIISKMIKPGTVCLVDCPDVNEGRFTELLVRLSGNVHVRAEHKADEKYPAVSAASIIAKVVRERKISEIKNDLGDFGSGYPSDRRTIEFIKNYYAEHRSLPPHVRKSWKTINLVKPTLDSY